MMIRRLPALLAGLLLAGSALAQSFPTKPVKFVVPARKTALKSTAEPLYVIAKSLSVEANRSESAAVPAAAPK